jgi:hypothetical protein
MRIILTAGAAVLAAGFIGLAPQQAHAADLTSQSQCVAGLRVATKDGQTGTVIKIDGYGPGVCDVRMDRDGSTQYFSFWFLHPAGSSSGSNAQLRAGVYKCYSLSDGHMNYTFMDIAITGAGTYSSGGGSFRFAQSGQNLRFLNGPLAGRSAEVGAGPSLIIGATTCDLNR